MFILLIFKLLFLYFLIIQMYVQDVALPTVSNKNKKKAQNYSSRNSLKSSFNDDRQAWCEGNIRRVGNVSGESGETNNANDYLYL